MRLAAWPWTGADTLGGTRPHGSHVALKVARDSAMKETHDRFRNHGAIAAEQLCRFHCKSKAAQLIKYSEDVIFSFFFHQQIMIPNVSMPCFHFQLRLRFQKPKFSATNLAKSHPTQAPPQSYKRNVFQGRIISVLWSPLHSREQEMMVKNNALALYHHCQKSHRRSVCFKG